MISELNRFATENAGLTFLTGVVLAIVGVAYGVYARHNPARPKHRLNFKPFGFDGVVELIGRNPIRRRRRSESYKSHVDIWNYGSEPITAEVIREPLSVGIQSGSSQQLISAEVVRESHPGLSNFSLTLDGNAARLSWEHFDPGMCVRLSLDTKEPIGNDEIEVFGSGFRMDIRRVRPFDDSSTLAGKIIKLSIGGILPLAIFSNLAGSFLQWATALTLSKPVWMLLAAPIAIALLLIVAASFGTGLGLLSALGRMLNLRSPLERQVGVPHQFHDVDRFIADERYRLDVQRLEMLERDGRIYRLSEPSETRKPHRKPRQSARVKPDGGELS